jgi:hypothetical protein
MTTRLFSSAKLKWFCGVWFIFALGFVTWAVTGLQVTRETNTAFYTYPDKPAPPVKPTPLNVNTISAPNIPADLIAQAKTKEVYGQLPLSFEPNLGQTDPSYTLFLTDAAMVVRASAPVNKIDTPETLPHLREIPEAVETVVQFQWLGANPQPKVEAVNRQSSYSNYFIGIDAAKWLTEVPNYGGVRYQEVYKGIDIHFHSQGESCNMILWLRPKPTPCKSS